MMDYVKCVLQDRSLVVQVRLLAESVLREDSQVLPLVLLVVAHVQEVPFHRMVWLVSVVPKEP